jgi:chromate reductase
MDRIIGILTGSLRRASFSKKLATVVLDMAPEGFQFKIIEIGELALYNQDFDDDGNAPPLTTLLGKK